MATKKRKCAFGDKCYRKNKDHFEEYEHPSKKIKQKEEEIDNEKLEIPSELEAKSSNNLEDANEKPVKEEETGAGDIRTLVFEQNKMEMPEDFYDFLEFCRTLDKINPKMALKAAADIELVGIYDLILNDTKADYKVYYRYFYDVPEFQTVLKGDDEKMLHFGYFRDDPNKLPDFVAINEANVDCKIISKGENIFCAVNWHLDELLKSNQNDKTKINDLKDLKKKLIKWCETSKHKWSLQLKSAKLKSRDKSINCKTFHEAGICVAVDAQGFGYREVPETYDSLKKMFTNFCLKADAPNVKAKKLKAEESIQELMTLTQFANDESDYGMSLELGQCMFSFGDQGLHKYIKNLLSICYALLNRNLYSDIIKAHLANRLMKITQ